MIENSHERTQRRLSKKLPEAPPDYLKIPCEMSEHKSLNTFQNRTWTVNRLPGNSLGSSKGLYIDVYDDTHGHRQEIMPPPPTTCKQHNQTHKTDTIPERHKLGVWIFHKKIEHKGRWWKQEKKSTGTYTSLIGQCTKTWCIYIISLRPLSQKHALRH